MSEAENNVGADNLHQNNATVPEETYEIVFRNGALKNLKSVAKDLGVPESDLKQVVNKSINLLTLVKSGKFLFLEDDKGNRFRVDLNRL
ncbi:MAG: hypothetical protein V1738_02940 [Patescibacteria group bacterium]